MTVSAKVKTSSKVVVFPFLYNFGRCQCGVQKPTTSATTVGAGTKKPTSQTVIVCEKVLTKKPNSCSRINGKTTLFCPAYHGIQITHAFYGRDTCANRLCFEYQSCQAKYCPSKTRCTCSHPKALDVCKTTCDGKQTCVLKAHHSFFGGDPCPGENKYLRVSFKCVCMYVCR